jgi:NAD(P)-dependent dehydrogenase (short-subunit alcohol dehydrogenase family)
VLTQAVAPHIRQQGSGAIVHVAARPGIESASGMGAYSVSKAALVHLTRILDIELRKLGDPAVHRTSACLAQAAVHRTWADSGNILTIYQPILREPVPE